MSYYKINDPLKPTELEGMKLGIAALNMAESRIRSMLANPEYWVIEPIGKRIEITDLSETFDSGNRLVLKDGKLEWVVVPVF